MLGWDILRGLCAASVAMYHLLSWQDVAQLYPLGTYGVYLFFVLSGASLAFNYAGRIRTPRDYRLFLAARWMRLAPLYAVICVVSLFFFSAHSGLWIDSIAERMAWNISFAFGMHDPAVSAIAIGGWSLGIEAAFYLLFPLLLAIAGRPRFAAAVGTLLFAIQLAWIGNTVGHAGSFAAASVAYHQVPAFAAYFFGGCLIGLDRRQRAASLPFAAGLSAWAAMAVLLLSSIGPQQGDELLGWRGALLFGACLAVTWASGRTRVPARVAPIAQWLGDVTYGLYLMHPLFFFGVAWFLLQPAGIADPSQLPLAWRWALLVCVLALSCAWATASERWFERPLRGLVRARPRGLAPQPEPEPGLSRP